MAAPSVDAAIAAQEVGHGHFPCIQLRNEATGLEGAAPSSEVCWSEQERIAKLETPTPPGSPKDGADEAAGAEASELDEEQKKLLQAAVDFLREPQVQSAPMSAKINYLHQKLKLGAAGIKVAVGIVYGRASCRSSFALLV
jgi:hypothetical protein